MEEDTARAQAQEARRAHVAASRPTLPRTTSALSAVCAGAGVALVARGEPGWHHLVFLASAVVLFAVAHQLPTLARHRRGLHGYRGWASTENTTLLLCAVALVVLGFGATPGLVLIFTGLGLVAALAWYAMLRGLLVAGGRPRL